MSALRNARTPQSGVKALQTVQKNGSASGEKDVSQKDDILTGESVEYAEIPGCNWYVLRATRSREQKAYNIIRRLGYTVYLAQQYALQIKGKRRVWLPKPMIPQFLFVYSTPSDAEKLVKDTPGLPFVSYYYDHFKTTSSGYNPPLTVPFNQMLNFIKVTSVKNPHVRMVPLEKVRYQSGDLIRVIDGDFAGVIGRVARVQGQTCVVVNLQGVCLIATAFVRKENIEKLDCLKSDC